MDRLGGDFRKNARPQNIRRRRLRQVENNQSYPNDKVHRITYSITRFLRDRLFPDACERKGKRPIGDQRDRQRNTKSHEHRYKVHRLFLDLPLCKHFAQLVMSIIFSQSFSVKCNVFAQLGRRHRKNTAPPNPKRFGGAFCQISAAFFEKEVCGLTAAHALPGLTSSGTGQENRRGCGSCRPAAQDPARRRRRCPARP